MLSNLCNEIKQKVKYLPPHCCAYTCSEQSDTSDTTYMRNIWLTDGGVTIRNQYTSSLSITNSELLKTSTWMWLIIVADFTNSMYIHSNLLSSSNTWSVSIIVCSDSSLQVGTSLSTKPILLVGLVVVIANHWHTFTSIYMDLRNVSCLISTIGHHWGKVWSRQTAEPFDN